MTYTKVFVGNLSFKTKGQDLAGEFSAVGKVLDANIITRGSRSLGYGFVDMETEENALKAVTVMNKKNVDGRDINVELARPRDEAKVAERKLQQQNRPPRQYNNRNAEGGDEKRAEGEDSNRAPSSPSNRGRRRFNNRKPRGAPKAEGGVEVGTADSANAPAPKAAAPKVAGENAEKKDTTASPKRVRKPRARRPSQNAGEKKEGGDNKNADNKAEAKDGEAVAARPPRGGRRPNNNNNNEARTEGTEGQGEKKPFFRRRRRNNSRLEGGTPSTNLLFVANLPFSLENQGLEDVFAAHNVKSAKVIFNKNGRSKGFGFVEVATEKDQVAALEALHDKPVQGRTIAVKVAIIPKPREEDTSAPAATKEKAAAEPEATPAAK